MTTPYERGDTLDYLVLGTVRSPGRVTLTGHDRDENWDDQNAKGQDGATSTLNGPPLGQFQASFYLTGIPGEDGTNDFERWESFQRLIDSTTSGPTPVALPIYHPDLARNRYTEVVKASVSGMVHDGRGGATVIVKFREHKPPRPKPAAKAVVKPNGNSALGTGGLHGPPPPDPNAVAKAKLASLLEEARQP